MPLVLRSLRSCVKLSHSRFICSDQCVVVLRNASIMAAIETAIGVETEVPLIERKPPPRLVGS